MKVSYHRRKGPALALREQRQKLHCPPQPSPFQTAAALAWPCCHTHTHTHLEGAKVPKQLIVLPDQVLVVGHIALESFEQRFLLGDFPLDAANAVLALAVALVELLVLLDDLQQLVDNAHVLLRIQRLLLRLAPWQSVRTRRWRATHVWWRSKMRCPPSVRGLAPSAPPQG